MPNTVSTSRVLGGADVPCLGFAFLVLWITGVLHIASGQALACAAGVTIGCAALFAVQLLAGSAAVAVGMDRRAFPVECGVFLALAAGGVALSGIPSLLLFALSGMGCALCAAAWFERIARCDMDPAIVVSLLGAALGLAMMWMVLAAAGFDTALVRVVVFVLGAVGSMACLLRARGKAPAPVAARAGGSRNKLLSAVQAAFEEADLASVEDLLQAADAGEGQPSVPQAAESSRADAESPRSGAYSAACPDPGLPKPQKSFLASFLVPVYVLVAYFGVALPFAQNISANPAFTVRLSMVAGALLLVLVLLVTQAHRRDWRGRHVISALLLLALVLITALLFADRADKVYLMALQLATRPLALVLLWLAALTFVRRGTYGPFQAFCFAFGLAAASLALGIVAGMSRAVVDFLGVFPHEGIYLFTACLVLALAYELAVVSGFFREGEIPVREGVPQPAVDGAAAQPGQVTVKLEADFLEERISALAAKHALTDRERQIVQLLALGRTRAFIAESLYLSENTVKWYCRQIYQKLGIHSKQELLTLVGVGE